MVDFSHPVTSPEPGEHSGYDHSAGIRQTGQKRTILPVRRSPSVRILSI